MLWASCLFGLLWVLTRLTSAVNIETMCHEHPYGTLLPNPRDCSSYYVCQSGPELAFCDHGLHFDRAYKVCNWPHWADCKIEEVEFSEHLTQTGAIGKLPEKNSNNQIEEQVENPEEIKTLPDNNSLDESDTHEDIHKPIHVHLSNNEAFNSNKVASHETPLELENSKQIPLLIVEVPVNAAVKDFDQDAAESKNVTHALEIPVAKPTEGAVINNPEIKNSEKMEVQVPVVVPETEIVYSKPVSTEISDNKTDSDIETQANSTHTVQVSISVPDDRNKSSGLSQVVQVAVVVPTEVSNSIPEGIEADKKDKNQSKSEITGEKMESQNPLDNQVIEATSGDILNVFNGILVEDSKPDVTAEKIASQKPLDNQIIELLVEVTPEEALSLANGVLVADSKPDITGEKIVSHKPLDNQVIELPVEITHEEALNVANGVLVVDSKPDITEEKMASQKPLDNQVIELLVEATPEEALNVANGVLVVNLKPETTGEKMQKPLDNQVIELPVEAVPEESSNAVNVILVESSKPGGNGQKGVDSQKHLENQVIELPVEAFTTEAVNLIPEEDLTPIIAVEKVESQKTSENSYQVVEIFVPQVSSDTSKSNKKIESSVGSGNSDAPSQIFHLPVPSGPGLRPTNSGNIDHNLNSNSEEESVEIPEEFNSQSSEEIAALASSSSSEEDIVQTSAESDRLSEEDEFLPDSIESANSIFSAGNQDMSHSSEFIQESEESSAEVVGNSNTKTNSHHLFASSSEEGSVQVAESAEKVVLLQNPTNFESSEEDEDENEEKKEEKQEEIEKVDEDEEEESKFKESKIPRPNKDSTSSVSLRPNVPSKLVPIDKIPNSQGEGHSQNKTFNLIVSMLSVVSAKKDNTINRPIVGAHSTETGHPIETMTGYNTRNVQCIHDGLYFLPHPSSCQKYFICAYRNLHLHSCGDDLIWNFKREQCEVNSNSRCYSREAHDAVNKSTPINASGISKETTLSSEKATITTRMPPVRTTQTSAVTARDDGKGPICPGLRQMYLPSFDDCNKYYICILGEPVLTFCPDNLHWDVKGEFCGHPEVTHCAGS